METIRSAYWRRCKQTLTSSKVFSAPKGLLRSASALRPAPVREGDGSFTVDGNQVGAINNYMKSRNNHYKTNTSHKAHSGKVTTYKRNGNGEWYAETEEKTFVT